MIKGNKSQFRIRQREQAVTEGGALTPGDNRALDTRQPVVFKHNRLLLQSEMCRFGINRCGTRHHAGINIEPNVNRRPFAFTQNCEYPSQKSPNTMDPPNIRAT